MKRLILDGADGLWAALMEDKRLVEIHNLQRERTGDLFLARVQKSLRSLDAAFVDIGEEKNAFLPLKGKTVRGGDMFLVQATAEQSTESKGLRVTTEIAIPGFYGVLLPGERSIHVSKKISDPEIRDRLAGIAKSALPEGDGMIIRTLAAEHPEQLEEEIRRLVAGWQELSGRAAYLLRPGRVFRDSPVLQYLRTVHDLEEIVVNTPELLEELRTCEALPPEQIRYYDEVHERRLLFDTYQIESQIEAALKPSFYLPCGGQVVIDYCEALTVYDVNSAKAGGRDKEKASLKVNQEAVTAIARHLRLGNIGGMVIIDLIDMDREENRKQVLQSMEEATRDDSAGVHVLGISHLGLLELTRSRRGPQLRRELLSDYKPDGFLTPEEDAARVLREIRRRRVSGQEGQYVIQCRRETESVLRSRGLEAEFRFCPGRASVELVHTEVNTRNPGDTAL